MDHQNYLNPLLLTTYRMLGPLGILVPSFGVFAAIDFSNTITLGSVLLGFVVIVISGIFTIRSRIANIWRQEAEGERAARIRLEHDLAEERASRAAFEREQQELRHALKDELAGTKAMLKAMEAKTDLTAALDAIKEMHERSSELLVQAMRQTSVMSEERDQRTQSLLTEIRDKLPNEPIAVRDITEE